MLRFKKGSLFWLLITQVRNIGAAFVTFNLFAKDTTDKV